MMHLVDIEFRDLRVEDDEDPEDPVTFGATLAGEAVSVETLIRRFTQHRPYVAGVRILRHVTSDDADDVMVIR
jgi:hypothetical protein